MCEELQTFIQDSKEVLWSEVRHIPDMAKTFVQNVDSLALAPPMLLSDEDQLQLITIQTHRQEM